MPEVKEGIDIETAKVESVVLKEHIVPVIESGLQKSKIPNVNLLKETAVLELSGQALKEIQEQHPEYYRSLMSLQDATLSLAETLTSSYVESIFDDSTGHMLPETMKQKADEANIEEWGDANKDAFHTAKVVIGRVSLGIINKNKDDDFLDKFRRIKLVNEGILTEMTDNHNIRDADSRRIGALTQGVLASLEIKYWEKKANIQGYSLDVGEAFTKQQRFNEFKNENE